MAESGYFYSMHIHRISSNTSRNRQDRILLRESYRDGNAIRKHTLANLTAWSPQQIEALEKLLEIKRLLRGLALEKEVDGQIFKLISETEEAIQKAQESNSQIPGWTFKHVNDLRYVCQTLKLSQILLEGSGDLPDEFFPTAQRESKTYSVFPKTWNQFQLHAALSKGHYKLQWKNGLASH